MPDETAKVFDGISELEDHFGFLTIHASRNYGGDSPLSVLCDQCPTLTFAGVFQTDINPEMCYTFEGRNGERVIVEEFDNYTLSDEAIKALIEKREAKIARLQEELSNLKEMVEVVERLSNNRRQSIGTQPSPA